MEETVWKFLKKWKIELPYDPAEILLLDIYLEKTLIEKYMNPMLTEGSLNPNIYNRGMETT